ncbi:MAG: NADH-quinone oxidoreductase subunit B, partial [Anaerolineae bacterium]
MGIETALPEGAVVTTTLEKLVDWGRGRSPFPLLFGLACCAIEMMAAGGPR